MSPPDNLDRLSHAELKGLVVKQWEQIVELQRMVGTHPVKATGLFQLVDGLPIFRRVLLRGASAARRRLIWSMSNC